MSEGSMRDSLSLLDQALANNDHQQLLTTKVVEKMVGLNDKIKVIELFEALLNGDFVTSLKKFSEFYSLSSDILQLLQDLMEITHKTTVIKLVQDYSLDGYLEFQQQKIKEIANKISLSSLSRLWQMLLKGHLELAQATSQKMVFEMLLARICHLAALPNLQQVLLNGDDIKNSVAPKQNDVNDDVMGEILRNFEGAKIIN
jgi:DNA polymerase-3 subunit gamma/tau